MTSGRGRRRGGRDGRDEGYVSVMVAGVVLAVMAAIGLLVDGSIALAAHRSANNEAEQAARAAAQAIDLTTYTGGQARPRIDPDAARAAAGAYLAGTGDSYTVEITGPAQITVTVTVVRPTRLLSMVGVPSITAVGVGRSTQLFGAG
ncbi:pilus assembly protein TadG-related protein [Parafrankia discariae]|uniref:pilus assembly protein TadG-related protein n=1 Tax=Parafrankia discariae TaxID=365528 RepID=UPI001E43905E|nr:pilus assembly protein TadG-related protein [Parafrankia discariae]